MGAAVAADDPGESTVIGDTGAHALGVALGAAMAAGTGRAGLAAQAAALIAAAAYGDQVTQLARSPM
ncbi:hypothetical protein [Streptomyces sp. NPDC002133]|uniref:hypothetical protein n=1 Tax=Streptomyces sp. NPDC002133 TaxID=3154409 RepID=UPI00332DF180